MVLPPAKLMAPPVAVAVPVCDSAISYLRTTIPEPPLPV